MANIQKLSSTLINQIAAGEVVDRPASIVKELLENAIDAGAKNIQVHTKDGGRSLIQVNDDGSGMSKEDLGMAFQRHSTSKIANLEDLSAIRSMGFRGEALASIASVAHVRAQSRFGTNEAFEYIIHGGEEQSFRPCANEMGSSFAVENLFFNTPARRKFLKSAEQEKRFITAIMRRFALAFPEISFLLKQNGKVQIRTHSGKLEDTIRRVYSKTMAENILALKSDETPFHLHGFVGNLNVTKKRQGDQFIFLNRRAIRDKLINSAVFGAYFSLMQRGEYPFFVLNLEVPPEFVDVNVHPGKQEVHFQDEWRIHYFVKRAVQDALKDIFQVMPGLSGVSAAEQLKPTIQKEYKENYFPGFQVKTVAEDQAPRFVQEGNNFDPKQEASKDELPDNSMLEIARDRISQKSSTEQFDSGAKGEIWQISKKYLVSEISSGLIIIDQHVAHERILYEQARADFERGKSVSQALLFPVVIQFQADEFSMMLEVLPFLEKVGFSMQSQGKYGIVIDGIPPDLAWGREEEIIREIIDIYQKDRNLTSSHIDHLFSEYACKAAVKAGDFLNPEERRSLVDRLFATSNPYYCPHGRPIVVNLKTEELDKRFERI